MVLASIAYILFIFVFFQIFSRLFCFQPLAPQHIPVRLLFHCLSPCLSKKTVNMFGKLLLEFWNKRDIVKWNIQARSCKAQSTVVIIFRLHDSLGLFLLASRSFSNQYLRIVRSNIRSPLFLDGIIRVIFDSVVWEMCQHYTFNRFLEPTKSLL